MPPPNGGAFLLGINHAQSNNGKKMILGLVANVIKIKHVGFLLYFFGVMLYYIK